MSSCLLFGLVLPKGQFTSVHTEREMEIISILKPELQVSISSSLVSHLPRLDSRQLPSKPLSPVSPSSPVRVTELIPWSGLPHGRFYSSMEVLSSRRVPGPVSILCQQRVGGRGWKWGWWKLSFLSSWLTMLQSLLLQGPHSAHLALLVSFAITHLPALLIGLCFTLRSSHILVRLQSAVLFHVFHLT